MEIRNDILKKMISESIDNKFPVKYSGSSIVTDSTKYYTKDEVLAMFPGYNIRYIDSVSGNDNNDGLTETTPWLSTWGDNGSLRDVPNTIYFVISSEYRNLHQAFSTGGDYIICGISYGAKNTGRTTNSGDFGSIATGYALDGSLDFRLFLFNIDITNNVISHYLSRGNILLYSCTLWGSGSMAELQSMNFCYIHSNVGMLTGLYYGNGKTITIKHSYFAYLFMPNKYVNPSWEKFGDFSKFNIFKSYIYYKTHGTQYDGNGPVLRLIDNAYWDMVLLSLQSGTSFTTGLWPFEKSLYGTIQVEGTVTGDLSQIRKLINDVIVLDSSFMNTVYDGLDPRGTDVLYDDYDESILIDVESYRYEPMYQVLNNVEYIDDDLSQRAIYDRIGENQRLTITMSETEWERGRYRSKMNSGPYLVSDPIVESSHTVTKQKSNLLQFDDAQAGDELLIGRIGFFTVPSYGRVWFIIESIESYSDGTEEAYYYCRTINAPSAMLFDMNDYTGQTAVISYRIWSLKGITPERVSYNLLRLTFDLSERILPSGDNNVFLEAE